MERNIIFLLACFIAGLAAYFAMKVGKLKASLAGMEEEHAKDRAVIASIGDGLAVVDTEGKVVLVDKAFEGMLGWQESEVKGKLFTEIVPAVSESGKIIPESERLIDKVLKEKTVAATVYAGYKRKDGTTFPVAPMVSPVVVGSKVIGAVEVFRDITKEREVDRAKTEFVSLASHQLKTPLTSIGWYAEMLLAGRGGKLLEKEKHYLEKITNNHHRMVELVNALLNVSRLEMGTLVLKLEPTDISVVADETLDEMAPNIDNKKLSVERHYKEGLFILTADRQLLHIILQNLLSNAVKYSKDGSNVSLTIEKQDTNILVVVSDSGCGIPQAQQSEVFKKFFRADNVKEQNTGGSGLGLYLAKAMVDQLCGRIWFESQENQGSTFYVELPSSGKKEVQS